MICRGACSSDAGVSVRLPADHHGCVPDCVHACKHVRNAVCACQTANPHLAVRRLTRKPIGTTVQCITVGVCVGEHVRATVSVSQCMSACMRAVMSADGHARMWVCMPACMSDGLHVCNRLCACAYASAYADLYLCRVGDIQVCVGMPQHIHEWVYVGVNVCIRTCIYVYVCAHIYRHVVSST